MSDTEATSIDPVRRRDFGWGLLDQALASVTTFALMLAVARESGPTGVGAVAVAYAAFLVAFGIQRALLIEPYLTRGRVETVSDRHALGASMSLSLAGSLLASAIFAVVGVLAGGPIGDAFLAFAPWVTPMLLQALLRIGAFRNGQGAVAASGSALMLVTFLIAVAIGVPGSTTALVAAWGVGGLLTTAWLLVAGHGPRLVRPMAAARWWQSEAMHFGGWLLSGTIAWSVFSYGLLAGLAAVTGIAAVGGYRAIESVFSPLSLIAPALANPGFKAMRDSWARQPSDALGLAFRLSGIAMVIMAAYALCVGVCRDAVFFVYGEAFRTYSSLILPIAVGQTLLAGTIGFITLLKVARRGRDTAVVGAGGPFFALLVGIPLGAYVGITAAAWGIALSFLPPLVWAIRMARAVTRSGPTPAVAVYPAPPPRVPV